MNTSDRGGKEVNFQVLREADCPAVLVEVAFISNEADRLLLSNYAGQMGAALAIAAGVSAYSQIENS